MGCVGSVGIPKLGLVVFAVEQGAVVGLETGVAAEGVVAGGVVAATTGRRSAGVLLAGTFAATVDVEPDLVVAVVNQSLRDLELVEGVGVGRVAQLPDEGFNLRVGGVFLGDQGDA